MKFEINNLKLNNYVLDMKIYENEKIGFYCKDKLIITDLLELMAGINMNNNTISVNDSNAYDNIEYFSNRLYFDFSKKYLTTLRVNKIEDALKDYNLKFDKDKFVKICKELNIRGETDITYRYEFTDIGNSFVNLALLCSLDKKNIIVNNPLANLHLKSDFNYFADYLTSNDFQNVILGLDNLSSFKGKLDRVVFFSDYNEVIIMHNNDNFIVFDKDVDKYFLIKNKVYKGKNIVALNLYTKDQLKLWQKQKVNYEIVSIYDIEKYLGEVWKLKILSFLNILQLN